MKSSQKGLPRGDKCEIDMEGLVHLTMVKAKGSGYLCSGGSKGKCLELAIRGKFLLYYGYYRGHGEGIVQ